MSGRTTTSSNTPASDRLCRNADRPRNSGAGFVFPPSFPLTCCHIHRERVPRPAGSPGCPASGTGVRSSLVAGFSREFRAFFDSDTACKSGNPSANSPLVPVSVGVGRTESATRNSRHTSHDRRAQRGPSDGSGTRTSSPTVRSAAGQFRIGSGRHPSAGIYSIDVRMRGHKGCVSGSASDGGVLRNNRFVPEERPVRGCSEARIINDLSRITRFAAQAPCRNIRQPVRARGVLAPVVKPFRCPFLSGLSCMCSRADLTHTYRRSGTVG